MIWSFSFPKLKSIQGNWHTRDPKWDWELHPGKWVTARVQTELLHRRKKLKLEAETVFSLPGRQSLPLVPKFCISGEARIISEPSDYQTGAQRWSRSEDMQGSKPGPMKKFWWCSNELFLCTIPKQIEDLSLSLHSTDAKSLANIKNQQAKFMRLKKNKQLSRAARFSTPIFSGGSLGTLTCWSLIGVDSFKNINCTFIPILIFPRLLPSEHHWVTSHHWIRPPVWPGRQSCGRYTECMPLALLRGGYQHLLPHLARSSWSTVTKLLHCCKERCFRNTYPTTRLHILYLEGLVYSNYCFLVFISCV